MKSDLKEILRNLSVFSSIVLLTASVLIQCTRNPDPNPVLKHAHAHNDYEHERPLLEALSLGFISVEADIHLRSGVLYVAHDSVDIRPERTLQALYLDPLKEWIQKNGGVIYDSNNSLLLLIDIKTDSLETYEQLHDVLGGYASMLTVYENGIPRPGPVSVIVSGNRPIRLIRTQDIRYAALDGRFENLDSADGVLLFPLVSESWTSHFTWKGRGPMPAEEQMKLAGLIERIHKKDQMIRFWATPDSASACRDSVWTKLLNAGVDLISTDDLQGLHDFLKYDQ